MRIIAGSARGRRLVAPEGSSTRPITDRAKEGIFNMIESRFDLDGVRVVDLYAGSGSFGLECLSRGAGHVTFVDAGREQARTIASNLESLGFASQATIVVSPVSVALQRRTLECELAFCDPPYADDPWAALLPLIDAQLLVGHAASDVELVEPWEEVRRKSYGRARVVLARRSLDEDPTSATID